MISSIHSAKDREKSVKKSVISHQQSGIWSYIAIAKVGGDRTQIKTGSQRNSSKPQAKNDSEAKYAGRKSEYGSKGKKDETKTMPVKLKRKWSKEFTAKGDSELEQKRKKPGSEFHSTNKKRKSGSKTIELENNNNNEVVSNSIKPKFVTFKIPKVKNSTLVQRTDIQDKLGGNEDDSNLEISKSSAPPQSYHFLYRNGSKDVRKHKDGSVVYSFPELPKQQGKEQEADVQDFYEQTGLGALLPGYVSDPVKNKEIQEWMNKCPIKFQRVQNQTLPEYVQQHGAGSASASQDDFSGKPYTRCSSTSPTSDVDFYPVVEDRTKKKKKIKRRGCASPNTNAFTSFSSGQTMSQEEPFSRCVSTSPSATDLTSFSSGQTTFQAEPFSGPSTTAFTPFPQNVSQSKDLRRSSTNPSSAAPISNSSK